MMIPNMELQLYAVISMAFRFLWLLVAIIGFIAYLRTKSLPILLQSLGALVTFFSTVVSFVLPWVLHTLPTTWPQFRVMQLAWLLIGVPGLLLFTTGFCMEKLRQARSINPPAGFPIFPGPLAPE